MTKRPYRRALTRDEQRIRKLYGLVAGVVMLGVGAGIVAAWNALFGSVSIGLVSVLIVLGLIATVWLEHLVGSRADQPSNREEWRGSWLDKPPYKPERPTRSTKFWRGY